MVNAKEMLSAEILHTRVRICVLLGEASRLPEGSDPVFLNARHRQPQVPVRWKIEQQGEEWILTIHRVGRESVGDPYARIGLMTLPWTSVRRKSRPL